GSERQKLAYLATLAGEVDWTISVHVHFAPDDLIARNLAITTLLQRKGRALDAMSDSIGLLRGSSDAQDQALLGQLADARAQIARLILGGPQGTTREQYQERISSLENHAESFEDEISRRSNTLRSQFLPITLEAVQARIPADAALIEFASYSPFNAKA